MMIGMGMPISHNNMPRIVRVLRQGVNVPLTSMRGDRFHSRYVATAPPRVASSSKAAASSALV